MAIISLTFNVSNIDTVRQIYNRIRVNKSIPGAGQEGPYVALTDMVPTDVELTAGQSVYRAIDNDGEVTEWYISQYWNT